MDECTKIGPSQTLCCLPHLGQVYPLAQVALSQLMAYVYTFIKFMIFPHVHQRVIYNDIITYQLMVIPGQIEFPRVPRNLAAHIQQTCQTKHVEKFKERMRPVQSTRPQECRVNEVWT